MVYCAYGILCLLFIVYVCVYICVYVYIYVHMCIYVHVCIYVHMCMCEYAKTCNNANMRIFPKSHQKSAKKSYCARKKRERLNGADLTSPRGPPDFFTNF